MPSEASEESNNFILPHPREIITGAQNQNFTPSCSFTSQSSSLIRQLCKLCDNQEPQVLCLGYIYKRSHTHILYSKGLSKTRTTHISFTVTDKYLKSLSRHHYRLSFSMLSTKIWTHPNSFLQLQKEEKLHVKRKKKMLITLFPPTKRNKTNFH